MKNKLLRNLIIAVTIMIALIVMYVIFDKFINANNKNLLTNEEALEIIKEKVGYASQYIYSSRRPYCGTYDNTDTITIENTGNKYIKSADYSSIKDVNDGLKTIISEEIIRKYARGTVVMLYVEENGKLYCLNNETCGQEYNNDQSSYDITRISEDKIELIAYIVYDTCDNQKTEKTNVILTKIDNNWVITTFDVTYSYFS